MAKAVWKINETGRPSYVGHVSSDYQLKRNEFYGTSPLVAWKNVKNIGDEPDYLEFKYRGYTCEIIRVSLFSLHLCGYVTLDKDNKFYKFYGKDYEDEEIKNLNVHGGITFSKPTKEGKWQIGFNCAHYDDVCPGTFALWGQYNGTYKDMWFVKKELIDLVDQIEEQTKRKKKLLSVSIVEKS